MNIIQKSLDIIKIKLYDYAHHLKKCSIFFIGVISMAAKIFIDGKAGTTGLRIYERLEGRQDIELITLSDELRKDPVAKSEAINSSDITFLCLPDAAARESVALVRNESTKIIDTSTAHRTSPDWAYGFPELGEEFEQKIRSSKRVAVPGCHASGFVSLVQPLVRNSIIPAHLGITCHSVTGYSGGGKNMIAQYELEGRDSSLDSPRQYGLTQMHKHLPEMTAITGLTRKPVFCPIVSDYYSGMCVTAPLFASDLLNGASVQDIIDVYARTYNSPIVSYCGEIGEDGFICANALSGKDCMNIYVQGNEERILLISRFDNLGKGASGAAVECMNIMLGLDAKTGLDL